MDNIDPRQKWSRFFVIPAAGVAVTVLAPGANRRLVMTAINVFPEASGPYPPVVGLTIEDDTEHLFGTEGLIAPWFGYTYGLGTGIPCAEGSEITLTNLDLVNSINVQISGYTENLY